MNKIILALILFLFLLIESMFEVPNETEKIPDISVKPEIEASEEASPADDQSQDTYEVVSVTDGDTFKVNINGKTETVRLVGINTPETVDPRKPVECFGKQASDKLKSLLIGKKVGLISDSTQSDRDRYGRLLRFATNDGQDVGLIMISEGFAQESLYSTVPHFMYEKYVQAQTAAIFAKVGLWAEEVCGNL